MPSPQHMPIRLLNLGIGRCHLALHYKWKKRFVLQIQSVVRTLMPGCHIWLAAWQLLGLCAKNTHTFYLNQITLAKGALHGARWASSHGDAATWGDARVC